MEKDYIDRKVKQCRKLVREATSDAQKKVYKEYLNFWQEKVDPKPVKPKKVKKKPEKVAEIIGPPIVPEVPEVPEVAEVPEVPVIVAVSEEILTEEEIEAEQFLDDLPDLPDLDDITIDDSTEFIYLDDPVDELVESLPETPIDYAALFEAEYPNKMAYRRKDGKLVETIAFKEFLKPKEETQ